MTPKPIGEGASSLFGDSPGVPNMSLALEQPQTCTGATLGLLWSERHFRDSRAVPPKRLLAPSPIGLGVIQEFGGCTRQSGSQLSVVPSWPKSLQNNSLKNIFVLFLWSFSSFFSWMQSVFVILTKLIASKSYYCKEVFCNNFGRDGIFSTRGARIVGVSDIPLTSSATRLAGAPLQCEAGAARVHGNKANRFLCRLLAFKPVTDSTLRIFSGYF